MSKGVIIAIVASTVVVVGAGLTGLLVYLNKKQDNDANQLNASMTQNLQARNSDNTSANQDVIVQILETIPQYGERIQKEPYRYCYTSSHTRIVRRHNSEDDTTGTLVGAGTGAVAGAMLGRAAGGSGIIGAAVGAVAGGAVGHAVSRDSTEDVPVHTYRKDCETRYKDVMTKYIYAYKIVYDNHGQQKLIMVQHKPDGHYVPLRNLMQDQITSNIDNDGGASNAQIQSDDTQQNAS